MRETRCGRIAGIIGERYDGQQDEMIAKQVDTVVVGVGTVVVEGWVSKRCIMGVGTT